VGKTLEAKRLFSAGVQRPGTGRLPMPDRPPPSQEHKAFSWPTPFWKKQLRNSYLDQMFPYRFR